MMCRSTTLIRRKVPGLSDQDVSISVQTSAPAPVPEKHSIAVADGRAYNMSSTGSPQEPIADAAESTLVYLELDTDKISPDDFSEWTSEDVEIRNAGSIDGAWFIMPAKAVTVKACQKELPAVPDTPSDGGNIGAGLAVALGGAAAGAFGYALATEIWLDNILPEGAAIPANRQQLAALLWETAGKPEPAADTVTFRDISDPEAQKAARWCAEKGLLSCRDENFDPAGHVFRFQVIQSWNALQDLLR